VSPVVTVKDVTADGTYEYATPTGWVNNFSVITQIEYPADEEQDPADAIIAPEKYGVYQNASAYKIRFYDITPAAGETIRISFTTRHAVVTASSTVFANDSDAVCSLAAAFCCFDLARRYGQDNDTFISADSVDRRSKSDKFLSLGKSLVNEYSIHFGLNKDSEVLAASGMKNLDLEYPGGVEFITHPAEDR
jgi:hypothetical protein